MSPSHLVLLVPRWKEEEEWREKQKAGRQAVVERNPCQLSGCFLSILFHILSEKSIHDTYRMNGRGINRECGIHTGGYLFLTSLLECHLGDATMGANLKVTTSYTGYGEVDMWDVGLKD
jgi:hypothetical protein